MNCTTCSDKVCRKSQVACEREIFEKAEIINSYQEQNTSAVVIAAAQLVDGGKAGTLSRVQEVIEFARLMNYQKIGLAYCYGMGKYARAIETLLADEWFDVSSVSCSVGGLKQSEVNAKSCIHKVSCNPLGQAQQLNAEKVDITIIIGICMGHDILLTRNLSMDFTTLVVKDRKHNHAPLLGFEE